MKRMRSFVLKILWSQTVFSNSVLDHQVQTVQVRARVFQLRTVPVYVHSLQTKLNHLYLLFILLQELHTCMTVD